jgi:hypothetical protein
VKHENGRWGDPVKDRITKRYTAYVCNSYNKESLKKVINVMRNYNTRNTRKMKLVVCGLPLIDELDCSDIINIGFAKYDNSYIVASKTIIIDEENQLENRMLAEYLHRGLICLVNRKCKILSEVCKSCGVGLIYSNEKELLAALEYIEKNYNTIDVLKLIYNASSCNDERLIKVRSEQIQQNIKDRRDRAGSLMAECNGNKNIIDTDRRVILKHSVRLDVQKRVVELLMIYKYVKLFIAPKAELYFTAYIDISSPVYRMVKALIKELVVVDVYFNTIPKDMKVKILEIESECLDNDSIEYAAEQIGMLI